ncbi:LuxR C-terminal-related transcriptional regulator [Variovorax sp. LjRoot130]|uniref:helix-turn-helix transcriptional regulator n=1 Tax=Variovorax sp. LjRoot130 TaxID=3342261 RepID=UPI003ECF60EB
MMTLMVQDQPDAGRSPEIALARLVDGLGNDRFGPALASYLHGLCGADHFAAFRLGHDELREVAACCVQPERTARDRVESYVKQGLWKHDPAMTEAQRCVEGAAAAIIHVDFSDHGYDDLRPRVYPHVRDRILLCGRGANGAFGLSVLRADSHSPFAHEAIEKLGQAAELLVAMLAKHANVCQSRPNVAQALTSLPEIESCIVATSPLPRREAEVCARILYGLSSVGIALDLTVSEETVKTYRKRAYQRLVIGSERELLTWYLARWSRWSAERFQAAASTALH